jgi:PleD family two-component response regulator
MHPAKSTRIFVAEDEAVIAMDLSERLTALGYEVCGTATRGETAVERIAELRPDLVLMDVHLAGSMDGVEVAQQLGERYDVPFVFLTAYSDRELIARASRTNSYGYLVKPFEERELHATLQVALARHAAERDLREQVTIDSLTRLHNRRFLDERLPIEISRARREGQTLSGRYGGEEFTVVMPGVDAHGAAQKMRSICAMLRESPITYRGAYLTFTVSAGVTEIPAAGGSPEGVLRAADAALYRAKQAGRDRVYEA